MAKVLLVEDDNNLREIFEMRLQAEGYQTVTAGDGEEALVMAMKEKPDLIIADVMMPKLSGFEMLETLRAAPEMSDTKVMMMTALGQAEDRARGDRLGVIKYLVKSQVTLEDFVRVVREVLQPDQPSASNPQTTSPPANAQASTINKESEKPMPDDNAQPTNAPAPGGDSAAPTNPISDAPADGQQSSAQEQDAVQGQINDFVSGAPTDSSAPAGDSQDIPVASPPPADDSGTPASDQPAEGEGSGSSPQPTGTL